MDKQSEKAYQNLVENIYILDNKANYDWLMESMAQLERGEYASHDLIDDDASPVPSDK
jgi:antitoxin YefM